uniref:DUF1985 domain-containing protein n=1 Tax=Brassica oleracea var. oleracea TaxID=109376 RepID=A0A0D3CFI7_BRAOL
MILTPAAEYRKCHSSLARENCGDFPGSRKTRVINFVVLPTLGGKRPSAVGESSPAIIRPQTTPAVMMKSKLSQTTVRRRTRSSGEELPERPPAKQQRYPDSGSEDGPVGGDSSGGQFSDGVPSSVLPRRLFAYGAYPTKLRVNIYSKSHVIGSVAAALKGTDAMDTLMASQFRGLFQLPVVRCQNSTKLIGCLLSRQLVTARRHEFWFTFGPDPLRFSLDEFRDVTGLNCGAFDVQDSEASESVPPTMWNKLFDTAVGKLTVLSVLRMLGNEYLAVEKRLPLALIALVDGVLCPSSKDLKLTPMYVEMLSDVESFLAYPWGRESFLTTVPRFLPPLVVAPGENPLQVMRDRLSQKTTVCSGFPLALQLFVFDDVPLLLEKIPDARNTTTFIDSPGACSSPSTILTVDEIVAVEEDPDRMQKYSEVKRLQLLWLTCLPLLFAWLQLSVHFTVIPDEERLLLVDQNEDRQVTSLVQKLLCGETFKPEDFPGGDQSFSPKFKVPDAAQGEGACPTPKTGADNGGESGQTSNQNDGERLEQVSAPMGFVEALVKEINSEIPGADEKTGGDNGGEFVEEDPDGGEEARTADKQPQSFDSVETSNMEFPKPVEAVGKVAPPKSGGGQVLSGEASVKEINAELQGTEDEERYDSCKDDMSTDSQIQENPRDLCGETDADSEDVGSGDKWHRMRSSKISGVYTPDPKVKKLFKSEEKVEYKPIAKTNRTQFKKFAEILRENPEQMWDIATGHSVCNHFFLEIAEPGKWMSDEETINCWISEGRSRKVISAIIARLCCQRCANDVQNSVIIVSERRQAKDHKKSPTSDPNSMEAHVLPNLSKEIVCKIIKLVGEEAFYNLGPFLRAGKRGYALAHEPSVLKKCDVSEMEDGFVTCQIRQGCQFWEFHLKCVSAGNRKAIYYECLLTAPSIGLQESIKILEPNVPMHGFSTLAVAIFNVCLGNDKEASKVFQLFVAYHHDLRSDDTCEMGESIDN